MKKMLVSLENIQTIPRIHHGDVLRLQNVRTNRYFDLTVCGITERVTEIFLRDSKRSCTLYRVSSCGHEYRYCYTKHSDHKYFGTSVNIEYSTEGPRYDPYGSEELTINRLGNEVTLKTGLVCYIEVNGIRLNEYDTPYKMSDIFYAATGICPALGHESYFRKSSRCPKCGSRELEGFSGYVGETIIVCRKCNEIVGDNFHKSMIE